MRTERAARPTLESLEGRNLQSGVVSPVTSSHALACIEPDDDRRRCLRSRAGAMREGAPRTGTSSLS